MFATSKLLVQRLLAGGGWDIHRGVPWTIHRQAIFTGAGVGSVLDVGANEGLYGTTLRKAGFAGTIHSFEPLPDAFALLSGRAIKDGNWHAVNAACGDAPGTLELNRSENSVSSSFLEMRDEHIHAAPQSRYSGPTVESEVLTLDDYMDGVQDASQSFHLKMDVQGYEDRVISGAKSTLDRVYSIEFEASFTQLYSGQAEWMELIQSLTPRFRVIDIRPGFRAKDYRLLQADVLMIRDAV